MEYTTNYTNSFLICAKNTYAHRITHETTTILDKSKYTPVGLVRHILLLYFEISQQFYLINNVHLNEIFLILVLANIEIYVDKSGLFFLCIIDGK